MAYSNYSKPRGFDISRNANEPRVQVPTVDIGKMTAELFSDTASKAADACAAGRDTNKSTQLRRFYDELVMWTDKVYAAKTPEEQDAKFNELLPYIQMLRAKVAYAKGRKLVDDNFKTLFDRLIQQVKSKETLKMARLFMEAFMGYKKCLEQ